MVSADDHKESALYSTIITVRKGLLRANSGKGGAPESDLQHMICFVNELVVIAYGVRLLKQRGDATLLEE